MARLGASKKKKNPRANQLSSPKKVVQHLTEQLESRDREQTATSENLRVIADSPTDLQPVLDVVAENAARLCEANDAVIFRIEGDSLQCVANYGPIPVTEMQRPIVRGSPGGRAVIDRQTIHVHDIAAEVETEFSEYKHLQQRTSRRTVLATPLLRRGIPIGVIFIRRTEVRPFTDKQIALLKTFADQAVIAIENVRLFQELKESLEQQTATSEILSVIASSPTDIQPVFQTILDNAVRLCEAQNGAVFRFDGEVFRAVVWNNISPALDSFDQSTPIPPGRESALRRVGLEKRPVHIPDMLADPECIVPEPYREEGIRTNLGVPLLKENELIGAIAIHRREVRPFTENQIKLLETFADQAVIAIENVRLFQELKESLEQQTATSEILGVIASSPTNLQPVLETVATNAARLCDAADAVVYRVDGDWMQPVAIHGPLGATPLSRNRGSVTGRAVTDRREIHVYEEITDLDKEFPESTTRARQRGLVTRTILAVPLLREGEPLGAILIRRVESRPFTDKQIALLKTFADQAVIAIENVRLFKEIQERNAELREALEHQTATAEVLGIISRSPTDVQPVLDAIVASAARVCGIDDVVLRLREGKVMVPRAHFGSVPIPVGEIDIDRSTPRWVRERGTLHIPDVRAQDEIELLDPGPLRTFLIVPLRQQGELIGNLAARRTEVRPFTPAQIKLLETFADQAVIAIENVRLFQELKESLEQQTATSEILGVIASSPTDIQPVLNVVADHAARLCDAADAVIYRVDGNVLNRVAICGPIPITSTPLPLSRGSVTGRAVVDRQTIHIRDIAMESEADFPDIDISGNRGGSRARTRLAVPLLREGVALGAILIRRMEVRPFTDKQQGLLKTFADQAVIAIENVRLFKEIQERNAELREALEHQTATAEVLGIISRSPT